MSVCKFQSQSGATGRDGLLNTAPSLRVWVHVPGIIAFMEKH